MRAGNGYCVRLLALYCQASMYSSQHTVHCRGVVKFLELKNCQIRLNKELVFFLVKVVLQGDVIITSRRLQLVSMEFVFNRITSAVKETFSDGDVTLCQHS